MVSVPARIRIVAPTPELGPGDYRVYDRSTQRPRLLKLLDPEKLQGERFEALRPVWKDSLRVDHPGLLRLVDTLPRPDGQVDGTAFLLFEDTSGILLEKFLEREASSSAGHAAKPGQDHRLELLWQITSALAHLHQRARAHGVLDHRRILVETKDGYPFVRLADWVPDSPERIRRSKQPAEDLRALGKLLPLFARWPAKRPGEASAEPDALEGLLDSVERLLREGAVQDAVTLLRHLEKLERELGVAAAFFAAAGERPHRSDALAPSRERLLGEIVTSLQELSRIEPRPGKIPSGLSEKRKAGETAALFLVQGESGTGKTFLLEKAKEKARSLGLVVRELTPRNTVLHYIRERRHPAPKCFYVLEEAERWSVAEWKRVEQLFPTLLSGWPKAVLAISFRSGELAREVSALQAAWLRRPRVKRLEVGHFAQDELELLVRRALETAAPPKELAETLWDLSRGQPRLSLGVLAEWVEKGILLSPREGGAKAARWTFDSSSVTEEKVKTLDEWAAGRFQELPPPLRKAVGILAALRTAAPATWVARLLPGRLEHAEAILEELARIGLVVRVSGPPGSSSRYRVALLELEERARKGDRDGDGAFERGALLEEEYARREIAERAELLEPLAWNYLERRVRRKAWAWGLRAIRELLRSGAARRALALGKDLFERAPHRSRSLKGQLCRALVRAAAGAGRTEEAERWYERLTEILGQEPVRETVELSKTFGAQAIRERAFPRAIRWARRGMPAAKGNPDWESEFLRMEGCALGQLGKNREAEDLLRRAASLSGQSPEQRSRALHELAVVAFNESDYATAASIFEERLELVRDVPYRKRSVKEMLGVYHNLAVAYRNLGDTKRASENLERGIKLCARNREYALLAKFEIAQANVAQTEGRLEESLRLFARAIEWARQFGDRESLGNCTHSAATTHRYLGSLGEAERLYREALEMARAIGAASKEPLTLLHLGVTLLEQGRAGEAAKLLEESLGLYQERKDPEGQADARVWIAWLEARTGRLDRAEELLGEVDRAIVKERLRNVEGSFHRSRAESFLARGLPREALGSLFQAIPCFEKEPAAYEALEARLARSEILAAQGRFRTAYEELKPLQAEFRRIGSKLLKCRQYLVLAKIRVNPINRMSAIEKALTLAVECASPLLEAKARQLLGEELLGQGRDADRAKGELARARQMYRELGWPAGEMPAGG